MTSAQKPTAPAPAAVESVDVKPVANAAKSVKAVKAVKAPKEPKAVKAPAKTVQKPAAKAEKKKTPAADAPKVPKVKAAPVKTASAPAKKAPAAVAAKAEPKPKKPKLVRDSFTIPKPEYLVLDALKLRALQLQHPIKKGELLRAGIKALESMADAAFLAAVQAVPTIKTGRPAKD